jgi:hypothetical protein
MKVRYLLTTHPITQTYSTNNAYEKNVVRAGKGVVEDNISDEK